MSILNIAPKELAAGVRHISTTTKVELVSAIACIACFSVWIFGSGRPTTFGIPLFFTLLCLTCSFAGRLCLRILRVFPDGVDHFPLSFLFGFFIINSALYLLAWISPFGIIADSIALIVALAVVGRALRPVRPKAPPDTREDWPSLMCVIVSLIAATLWSQDSLRPLIEGDHVVIFKPCFDSFYHACQIRMLRESHGFSSMQDILMAGQPAPFYHYASYMTPALLSAATGISPYFAFACFLVPFGIFLTGLAAFALVRSWWGAWAGFGATAALLLLPDTGQVMHMPLQSYYFRCEAYPGGPYGVAIMAISWILMMKGCDSGRPSLIVVSFLSAAACIHYKSHIFVANALLLWLFPAFFARKLRWEVRVAWFVFAIASFLAIVKMTQRFPSVPLVQCDYSLSDFRSKMQKILISSNDSTLLGRKIYGRFWGFYGSIGTSRLNDLCWGAALLFFGTFGLFGVASFILAFLLWGRTMRDSPSDHAALCPGSGAYALGQGTSRGCFWRRRVRFMTALPSLSASSDPVSSGDPEPRSSVSPAVMIFPIVMIFNYIFMYIGLALDTRGQYYGDELIRQHLVWAYFAVSSWVGGAISFILSGSRFSRSIASKYLLIFMILTSMVFPAYYGRNILQPPESWTKALGIGTRHAEPRGLVDCAAYIRDHGRHDDVIAACIRKHDRHDSVIKCYWEDPAHFVSTWSERQAFVIDYLAQYQRGSHDEVPYSGGASILSDRLEKIVGFQRLTSLDSIHRFAATNHIRWYVLPPSACVQWPQSLVDAPVFSSGGYRVYQFW